MRRYGSVFVALPVACAVIAVLAASLAPVYARHHEGSHTGYADGHAKWLHYLVRSGQMPAAINY